VSFRNASIGLIVLIVPALLAAAPANLRGVFFTGSDDATWLIQTSPEPDEQSVLLRPIGGKWQTLRTAIPDPPATATCVGAYLHLIFPSGNYRIVSLDDQAGFVGQRLPGAPVAACEAINLPPTTDRSIVAVVAQPPSDPAPGKTGQLLAYQNTGHAWQRLTTLDNVPFHDDQKILAAVAGGELYLLIDQAEGRRLAAWSDNAWRDVKLDGIQPDARVVAMQGFAEQLALVAATKADDPAHRRLAICLLKDGRLDQRPITLGDGSVRTWPADELPLVTRLADQLALLWRDQEQMELATCDLLGGQIVMKGTVPPADIAGATDERDLVSLFTWAIVIAVLGCMFLLPPRGPLKVFSLPADARPAPWFKRLPAGLIDYIPFQSVGTLVFVPRELFYKDPETILRWAETAAEVKYAWILGISLYIAYCIIMEHRFGATLGKMIFKLRVAGNEARVPGIREILLRNLLKGIELYPGWMPLLAIAAFTRYRQRLGDMMARTAVIDISKGLPAPTGQDEGGQSVPPPPPPGDP